MEYTEDICTNCKKNMIRKTKLTEYVGNIAIELVGDVINPLAMYSIVCKGIVHAFQGYQASPTWKPYICDYCNNYELICPHCKKFTPVGTKSPVLGGQDVFVCANCHEKFVFGDR